jgi:opacity protein-like surface antigen
MKKDLKKLNLNALKSALVALALACTVGFAQAQDNSGSTAEAAPKKASKVSLGLRSGVNFSEFIYAGDYGYTSRTEGAQVGAFFNIQATSWVGLSLEAAWSQNGARNLSIPGSNAVHSFNMNTFQANLLTYFRLPVLSVYEPKIFIGPSYNFIGHVTSNTEQVGQQLGIKARYDVTDSFRKHDLGMIVGLGLDFDLKSNMFVTIDARYRHGLVNVNGIKANGNYGEPLGYDSYLLPSAALGNSTVRTSQFSIQVGLGFRL